MNRSHLLFSTLTEAIEAAEAVNADIHTLRLEEMAEAETRLGDVLDLASARYRHYSAALLQAGALAPVILCVEWAAALTAKPQCNQLHSLLRQGLAANVFVYLAGDLAEIPRRVTEMFDNAPATRS